MHANYISKGSTVDTDVELEAPVRTYGNVSIKKGSKIGAFTYINAGSRITANTHIGRYCSIGRNCEIGAYDHPNTWLTSSPFAYNIGGHFPDFKGQINQFKPNRPKQTIIGNDVSIGSSVIVKRGVRVGHGAIIGGCSIVTKDVPDYTIVGGVPAKVIRQRFSDDISQRLLRSEWWYIHWKLLKRVNFEDIEDALNQVESIKSASQSVKVHLHLSNHQNYGLVEDQLNGLISKGLDKFKVTSSKDFSVDGVNLSYFIRDQPDVLLSHGVADKNYFWMSSPTGGKYVNELAGLLVQGDWMKRRLLKSKTITLTASQIFSVGWPRLDYLRELQQKSPAISINEKIKICWAPTHDARKRGSDKISTSSYPLFESDALQLSQRYDCVSALHPRNSKDKKPTQDKLLEANIVISDFGTMVYEAWGLGKPVIFPRWILKDNIQKFIKNSAEAYIMDKRIGLHADSYEEMIDIIESKPAISHDVEEFMSDFLANYRTNNSVANIADALEIIYVSKFG